MEADLRGKISMKPYRRSAWPALLLAGSIMFGFNAAAHTVRMVGAAIHGDWREADLQGHFAAIDATDLVLLIVLLQIRKKETA